MEIMELHKNLVALYADSPLPVIVDLETQTILMICTGEHQIIGKLGLACGSFFQPCALRFIFLLIVSLGLAI